MIKINIEMKVLSEPHLKFAEKYGLTPYVTGYIVGCMLDNRKLEAVKFFKEKTGLGLKESRDAVEELLLDLAKQGI